MVASPTAFTLSLTSSSTLTHTLAIPVRLHHHPTHLTSHLSILLLLHHVPTSSWLWSRSRSPRTWSSHGPAYGRSSHWSPRRSRRCPRWWSRVPWRLARWVARWLASPPRRRRSAGSRCETEAVLRPVLGALSPSSPLAVSPSPCADSTVGCTTPRMKPARSGKFCTWDTEGQRCEKANANFEAVTLPRWWPRNSTPPRSNGQH